MGTTRTRRRSAMAAGVLAPALALGTTSAVAQPEEEELYEGRVEVVRGPVAEARAASPDGSTTISGRVFLDSDRDSRSRDEAGVPDVAVSNGRDVVRTDADGYYELPAYENMTLFVTKPAGYEVPVDRTHVPQFFYHHLPGGTPQELRFGGLPPTGPLPQEVNFPVVASQAPSSPTCAMVGDTQTYSNAEIGYLRDGVVEDLAERDDLADCGVLLLGDIAGDDLGLYPRIKEVMSLAGVPVRGVPGNHDIDFDATTDEHSFDTYRREIGPTYYSYDIGDMHVVGLDNVRYPCTPADDEAAGGGREFCLDPEEEPTYNGVIGEEQLEWLRNDLALVPQDRLVVIATHIPLVSFIDQDATKHQTDDVTELYSILQGRPALSLSGHTHTLENLAPGESFAGWSENVGVEELPFRHVVAGAASGSWWGGDLTADGVPMAFAREGTPGGYLAMQLDGTEYVTDFVPTPFEDSQDMAVSLNSPHFREWAETLRDFAETDADDEGGTPPVNVNDLGDPELVTDEDLSSGTWLVANVWNGDRDTEVTVQVDDGEEVPLARTQAGDGEGIREGLEYADPFAMVRQLQVARHAFRSTSGDERAQGYERFQGSSFGPADPRPEDEGTDQSVHLWRAELPAGLPEGAHTATVRAVGPHVSTTEVLAFEVRDERPPPRWRAELFADEEG